MSEGERHDQRAIFDKYLPLCGGGCHKNDNRKAVLSHARVYLKADKQSGQRL